MKTETKERITNENVRITAENVQHIGECNTTVWRRRKSIQKKYQRYVIMQG